MKRKKFLGFWLLLVLGISTAVIHSCKEEDKEVVPTSVEIEPKFYNNSTTITLGSGIRLRATVYPYDATNTDVTWRSSDASVASVDADGYVYGTKAGTVTITVTTKVGGRTARVSVTVLPESITFDKTSASIVAGSTLQLTATVTPTLKSVTWSSSNTSVASISTGNSTNSTNNTVTKTITAVTAGTTTITANITAADGSTKTATCAVTVTAATVAVTGVTVSPTTASLTVGGTQQLTATVAPSNATNKAVSWSSSNTSVATVNTNGLVTAVSSGSAIITVTTADGSKKATCTVTVTVASVAVTGVTVSPTSASLTVGGTQQLTATVAPSNATNKAVSWSSSNTSVATVTKSGYVTAVGSGSATITVTTTDGSKKATCSVTVTTASVAVTGVTVSPTSASLTVGGTQQLTATVTPSTATNKAVTWSSSNTSVATVSTSGLVTAIGSGSATITVTTTDGNKKATCSVTVGAPCKTPPDYNTTLTAPTTSWQTASGSIVSEGCYVYRVAITKGNIYTFKTDGSDGSSASFSTGIYLYNEAGNRLLPPIGSAASNSVSYTCSYTSTVYVVITAGYGCHGCYGSFTLAYKIIGKNPPDEYHSVLPTPTTSWQTHTGSISSGGNYVYRVSVTSGNKYTFKTDGTNGSGSSFSTGIYLYNEDGNQLLPPSGSAASNSVSYTCSYTSTVYVKIVAGYGCHGCYGSFTLAYRRET
jgi:uncharacterized protein YjdB